MGSPSFAVSSLDAILNNNKNVVGVITQPDKPKGRGYTLFPTPVKERALQFGLPVFTPEKLKDGAINEILKEINPDCIVVVAYGKILPEYILNYPKFGCINVHASLLPKYRGAAPINFAIINGENETGITTMFMDKGIDTGDMLLKERTPIYPEDDAETLSDRLAVIGADLLIKTLDLIEKNEIERIPQTGEATYTSLIDNKIRKIDFNKNKKDIVNLIKGLNPTPSAYTIAEGKNIKIFKAEIIEGIFEGENGDIIYMFSEENNKDIKNKGHLMVKVPDGAVLIKELQPEGKNKMTGEEFLRGRKLKRLSDL
ncbi:MAG: methionyl-tRNA formyltransferase [Clostridia bacterium]|nr:methionyl-tRNA formyltransferase [Clostridia bacterium]